MFYIIYKITNKLDGKIYIGKHQTKDLHDGYMGSGKLLRYAINKYGLENFTKEILFQFDNEADMNAKEGELVTEEFVKEDTNYNLCPGGNGGFGHININKLNVTIDEQRKRNPEIIKIAAINGGKAKKLLMENDAEYREKCIAAQSNGLKEYFKTNRGTFTGKSHTEETKNKLRKPKNQGAKNSQFGTMWITNGKENKKIKKDSIIPVDWYRGRVKFTVS